MRPSLMISLRWLAVAAALSAAMPAGAGPLEIVALGDSNTAGFPVGRRNAFPAIMEASLRGAGYDVKVSNRGISGDTTGGMLSRLDRAVPRGTTLAIVQGGYNDGRRGVSARDRDANIDAILKRLSARGVKVVLCGLSGADWSAIARRHGALLVPQSTCYDAASRGFDGLHMNRSGHRIVASRLTPVIQRVLGRR
ncbi:MAG: GDSL-type esterase/lipase family protein [Rhizobiaceae bacterium]